MKKYFQTLMAEHEAMLRHIISGFEAIPALQDELFQDIALAIWRALPNFRQQASVKTFVARIAHNILATHVNKAVKRVKTTTLAVGAEAAHFADPKTPYQQLAQKQRQACLLNAIRHLPLEQRQVLTLALEGMSYQEIAESLAITTNLVGVRLQRAKKAVTKLLVMQEQGD